MKAKHKRHIKKHIVPFLVCALLLALALTALGGCVNARTVRVRAENAYISGLDSRLEGLKLLFLSDFKLRTPRDAEQAVKLVSRLSELSPDMILLGGDITSLPEVVTMDALNTLTAVRNAFLSGIDALEMPVYAVYGDQDLPLSAAEQAKYANIRFLSDEQKALRVNGAKLTLFGVADYSSGAVTEFGYEEDGAAAVIAIAHDPRTYHLISVKTTGGHPCADLVLTGHTLGGQIRLFGRNFRYADLPEQYMQGSYRFSSPMLISSGIGWELLPVRLGTRPEALLITLTGEAPAEPISY